jgi:hypothetical protein
MQFEVSCAAYELYVKNMFHPVDGNSFIFLNLFGSKSVIKLNFCKGFRIFSPT